MADEQAPLQSWVFDFVSSSYQPYAPLRSMQHAGFRQTSWGGMTWDGKFRTRFPMTSAGVGPTVDSNGDISEGWNGQVPAVITYYPIRQFSSSLEGYVMVILTTSECWIDILGSAAINVTPRYTTGTISITTGTATLAGTGTAWSTEGIVAGQLVNLPDAGATWYSIQSVNSDTSITLKTNYAGATLTNQPYTIRRTGRYSGTNESGDITQEVPKNRFARIYNGDLYYTQVEGAGNYCVVKVPNITYSTPGTPEIIGAVQFDNLSGCDIWTGGTIVEIKGLELLSDGRVVLATTEISGGVELQSRIRYSSHLDPKVWNTAPGGFTDVTNLPGKMNGMLAYGPYLACHYDLGIVLATPTGQDDPPLNFQAIQGIATGCVNSRALVNTSVGQIFLGGDLNVYTFDGSSVSGISDATRTGSASTIAASSWHVSVDESHSLVWFYDVQSATATTGTVGYAVNFLTGAVTYHKFPTFISCAGGASGVLNVQAFVGIPSYDPSATGTSGATSTMVYQLSSASSTDVVPAFTGYTAAAALTLVTDWIDFDMMGVDKTLAYALLFYESEGAYSIRINAKRDGLSSETISFTTANTLTEEKFAKFFFSPKTSEKWQFTIDTTTLSTTTWKVYPQRMVLFFRPVESAVAIPR